MAEKRAWEQRPGEPILWFKRFQAYLQMGVGMNRRSVVAAYEAWRIEAAKVGRAKPLVGRSAGLPKSWAIQTSRWEWIKRAEAFDQDEAQQRQESYEEERLQDRELRRRILKEQRRKLVEALQLLDPAEAGWTNVNVGLIKVNEALRAEYDDMPTQRQQSEGKTVLEVIMREVET